MDRVGDQEIHMVRPPSSCHSPPGLGGLLGVVEVLGRRHLLWEGGTRQVGRWWGRSFPDSLYSIKYLEPVGVVGGYMARQNSSSSSLPSLSVSASCQIWGDGEGRRTHLGQH